MQYNVRCDHCGRFCLAKEKEENYGYCDPCDEEGWDQLVRDERELDPHGPFGDGSRLR